MLAALTAYHLHPALLFFLCWWFLSMLLQCESFLLFLTPRGKRRQALFRCAFVLMGMQTENILIAGLLGLLAWLALPSLPGRWLFFAAYAILTAYLILEQLYYKRFFDHFRPSRTEGVKHLGVRAMLSSTWQEMDGVFQFNALLGGGCLLALTSSLIAFPRVDLTSEGLALPELLLLLIAGILLLVGLPAAFSRQHHHLQENPLLVLAWASGQGSTGCLARWLHPQKEGNEIRRRSRSRNPQRNPLQPQLRRRSAGARASPT